jgi:hypothetical protein
MGKLNQPGPETEEDPCVCLVALNTEVNPAIKSTNSNRADISTNQLSITRPRGVNLYAESILISSLLPEVHFLSQFSWTAQSSLF